MKGLIQLIAYGTEDIFLTSNPQFSLFKLVYRKHTLFSQQTISLQPTGKQDFDKIISFKFPLMGDLLDKLFLRVKIPSIEVINQFNKQEEIDYLLQNAGLTRLNIPQLKSQIYLLDEIIRYLKLYLDDKISQYPTIYLIANSESGDYLTHHITSGLEYYQTINPSQNNVYYFYPEREIYLFQSSLLTNRFYDNRFDIARSDNQDSINFASQLESNIVKNVSDIKNRVIDLALEYDLRRYLIFMKRKLYSFYQDNQRIYNTDITTASNLLIDLYDKIYDDLVVSDELATINNICNLANFEDSAIRSQNNTRYYLINILHHSTDNLIVSVGDTLYIYQDKRSQKIGSGEVVITQVQTEEYDSNDYDKITYLVFYIADINDKTSFLALNKFNKIYKIYNRQDSNKINHIINQVTPYHHDVILSSQNLVNINLENKLSSHLYLTSLINISLIKNIVQQLMAGEFEMKVSYQSLVNIYDETEILSGGELYNVVIDKWNTFKLPFLKFSAVVEDYSGNYQHYLVDLMESIGYTKTPTVYYHELDDLYLPFVDHINETLNAYQNKITQIFGSKMESIFALQKEKSNTQNINSLIRILAYYQSLSYSAKIDSTNIATIIDGLDSYLTPTRYSRIYYLNFIYLAYNDYLYTKIIEQDATKTSSAQTAYLNVFNEVYKYLADYLNKSSANLKFGYYINYQKPLLKQHIINTYDRELNQTASYYTDLEEDYSFLGIINLLDQLVDEYFQLFKDLLYTNDLTSTNNLYLTAGLDTANFWHNLSGASGNAIDIDLDSYKNQNKDMILRNDEDYTGALFAPTLPEILNWSNIKQNVVIACNTEINSRGYNLIRFRNQHKLLKIKNMVFNSAYYSTNKIYIKQKIIRNLVTNYDHVNQDMSNDASCNEDDINDITSDTFSCLNYLLNYYKYRDIYFEVDTEGNLKYPEFIGTFKQHLDTVFNNRINEVIDYHFIEFIALMDEYYQDIFLLESIKTNLIKYQDITPWIEKSNIINYLTTHWDTDNMNKISSSAYSITDFVQYKKLIVTMDEKKSLEKVFVHINKLNVAETKEMKEIASLQIKSKELLFITLQEYPLESNTLPSQIIDLWEKKISNYVTDTYDTAYIHYQGNIITPTEMEFITLRNRLPNNLSYTSDKKYIIRNTDMPEGFEYDYDTFQLSRYHLFDDTYLEMLNNIRHLDRILQAHFNIIDNSGNYDYQGLTSGHRLLLQGYVISPWVRLPNMLKVVDTLHSTNLNKIADQYDSNFMYYLAIPDERLDVFRYLDSIENDVLKKSNESNIIDISQIIPILSVPEILDDSGNASDISGNVLETTPQKWKKNAETLLNEYQLQLTNQLILENKIKDIKNRKVEKQKGKFAWIKNLGLFLMKDIKFYIGDQLVVSYNDLCNYLVHQMSVPKGKRKVFQKIIGNVPELYRYDDKGKNEYVLHLPFLFWFCKYAGQQLPLISLVNTVTRMEIKLNSLEQLSYRDDHMKVVGKPKLQIELLANYIHLEEAERMKFAQSRHEYLIEQYQYQMISVAERRVNVPLRMINPCKYIFWVIQMSEVIDGEASDMINGEKQPFNLGKKYLLHDMADNTHLMRSARIKFNGKDREKEQAFGYFNYVLAQKFNHSLPDGCYVYPFSLYPMKHQPSGSANFNFLYDGTLILKLDNIVTRKLAQAHVFSCTQNILRIMSGMGGLGFYNYSE